jgi:hypothetical protein
MSLRRAATAVVLFAAVTAAHAQVTLLSEGFNNVATLAGSGWVLANASTPAGSVPGWFQGDQTIFSAQAGAPQAYVAANFNNAAAGGTLANWLISPTFSTALAGSVSFYVRADIIPDFADQLAWGFSNGGSSFADFTLGAPKTVGGDWAQVNVSFAGHGAGATGRFAIVYTGAADLANYVGVDTFAVTAVPEPETWALLLAGIAGLGVLKRRRIALR